MPLSFARHALDPQVFISTPFLTPSKNSEHTTGAAILDVLIPPYDEACGRDCTYYRAEDADEAEAGAGAEAGARARAEAGAGGGAARVRLVPCSPGDNFRVMNGEFVTPFPI